MNANLNRSSWTFNQFYVAQMVRGVAYLCAYLTAITHRPWADANSEISNAAGLFKTYTKPSGAVAYLYGIPSVIFEWLSWASTDISLSDTTVQWSLKS